MQISDYLEAGKAPRHLFPWGQNRLTNAKLVEGHAFLFDVCMAGLHRVDSEGYGGYTIMDDSDRELSRHLEAVLAAKGRVLKTGLGMGCFVRMCLLKPEVEHIDVIEIDGSIIEHFGAEFHGNERVTIHHMDAFDFQPGFRQWDLGWHDIYCEGNDGLAELHTKLILKFAANCRVQGAWQLPRFARKALPNVI